MVNSRETSQAQAALTKTRRAKMDAMELLTEAYVAQRERWPRTGRHILAQYDDASVVVYQAYRPNMGRFAATHGYFGGAFSLDRMSWIKPKFLWMMFRNGWGTKAHQEVTLAVQLKRAAFDEILAGAVHSSFTSSVYSDEEEWGSALKRSSVRLQWDPDHAPSGHTVERRAVQLGLRGETLRRYAREWIVGVEDISEFVRTQYEHVQARDYTGLVTPREDVYPVADSAVAARLGLSTADGQQ